MSLVVKKFGGTSVADIDSIKNVAAIIQTAIASGEKVVAVVSAMAGVTNSLISKCFSVSNLTTHEQMREYDASVSSGEIITASLLALQLDTIGVKAKSMQGWQVPVQTNHDVGDALVKNIPTDNINRLLDGGYIPVVTGFQGVAGDDVTTLGKGGSDTTAALLAAALGADRCDIYTDVDGVFTADPGIVEEAQKINIIEPHLMLRLSELGAKVLHPRAAQAALRYDINMRVISSFSGREGTAIKKDKIMEDGIVKAITGDGNKLIVKITLRGGNSSNIIKRLHNQGLDYQSLEITRKDNTGDYVITLLTKLTEKNKYNKLLTELLHQKQIKDYDYNSSIATVSLVGYGIDNKVNEAAKGDKDCSDTIKGKVLKVLLENDIPFYGITCCSTDMTIIVDDNNLEKAKRALHAIIEL